MPQEPNFRILIIDDNPEIHKDFIQILTSDSHKDSQKKEKLRNLEESLFGTSVDSNKPRLPNFHIDSASQGQEGVEKIASAIKENKPYALAFVDIRMPPGWDGIETIKHIWALDPNIQIVICTAYSDYSWEETVEQLGERENLLVLKKPFDNVAVRQLSCALTKKWQMLQDLAAHATSLEERVKERTNSLAQSLAVTRGTLESTADSILVIDQFNKLLDYNNSFVETWNIPKDLLESKDANLIWEFIAHQTTDTELFLEIIKNIMSKEETVTIEQIKNKNNKIIEFYTQPYKLDTKIAGRIWSFRDVTKRAELEAKLQYQSTHDVLTGLPNRILLVEHIKKSIEQSKRYQTQFGVLFLDLDRFKLINDSLSHSAGDELLKEVSRRINSCIRKMDTCARIGGDEFVVVVDLDDGLDMRLIATKLLETFNTPFHLNGRDVMVTTSIGMSVYPSEGNTPDDLLRNADIAMYRSKALGKNQFQFYTPELGKQSEIRLEMENDLRLALAKNEFFLVYQPQHDIQIEKVLSIEALIRWQHPKRGVLLPIDFIPLAEEMGLMNEIGEWVLREACKQNKAWQNEGFAKIRMAVNMASQQLRQPDMVERIKHILQESQLEPQYLELELTENVIINSLDIIDRLSELHKLGIHIALDDFGTGYSCLNYLSRLSIDRIKIDQSFIHTIDTNRGDEAILKAIISMAESLHLNVLAEGVETQNQLDFLRTKTCGVVQGFYFSQPLSAKDFEKILKSGDEVGTRNSVE